MRKLLFLLALVSTFANAQYSGSYLPKAGGTLTGSLTSNSNISTSANVMATNSASGAVVGTSSVQLLDVGQVGQVVYYNAQNSANNHIAYSQWSNGGYNFTVAGFQNDSGAQLPVISVVGTYTTGVSGIQSTSGSGQWLHSGDFQVNGTSATMTYNGDGIVINGSATGGIPSITTTGADNNISLNIATKGGGGINLQSSTAVTGSLTATGNVTVQGALSSTANTQPASPTNSGISLGASPTWAIASFFDQAQPANSRTSQILGINGGMLFRFTNDANTTFANWLTASGGGAGVTGIVSNSGSGAWTHTGVFNATGGVQSNGVALAPALSGTSASIGGSALVAGACSSGAATVTGATTSMVVVATPTTYPGDGFDWVAYVSATNTVTVKVCGLVAGTPTATTYNVRVIQ